MAEHNYLSNKDLLSEIHKSKISYCEFTDPKFHRYDIIVEDFESIFDPQIQQQAKENNANRISSTQYKDAMISFKSGELETKPKQAEYRLEPHSVPTESLIYRVYTFEHIPLNTKKKKIKKERDRYVKTNFLPFKHYIIENGEPVEVGRSHSKDGEFSTTHGAMTYKLSKMFMLLTQRYSQRTNWRGYTYLDEMVGQSLLQLSQVGLEFNELKSDNPFSYYTKVLQNSFTRVLNYEKKNQRVKDEILIDIGQNPSYSRQLEHEENIRAQRERQAEVKASNTDQDSA